MKTTDEHGRPRRVPPPKKVQLDCERTMHFTFWELSRFYNATGKSITDGRLTRDQLESEAVELIRAHLLRDDPDLTADQLAQILIPPTKAECMTAILDAWSWLLPDVGL